LFNASKTMEYLQGVSNKSADLQYFMWIQLAFTPEIFKSL
jgi:hypothetical protein